MMRPLGPEPLICASGMPRSSAIFFAIGDAKMRSPCGSSERVSCFGADEGSDGAEAGSAFGGSGALSADADDWGFSDAASAASEAAAERSSPGSPTMAIGAPTETPLVPSPA